MAARAASPDSLDFEAGWFGEKVGGDTSDKLQPYVLLQAKETGKEVRRGPYAVEVEIVHKGLRCVGKKVIFNAEDDSEIPRGFEEYCRGLNEIHHPQIVQFLGVSSSMSCSLIITEHMPYLLSDVLDKYRSNIPENVRYGVLEDVAIALRYLHERTPAITHRGLSASSVLLTQDMQAKITDVGMMDLLNLTPVQIQRYAVLSAYVPPEAASDATPAVDSFSYGVLVLHVFTGNLPTPTDEMSQRIEESYHGSEQAGLRRPYLKQFGELMHPLMDMVVQCLSDDPKNRPTAASIHEKVTECGKDFPREHEDRIKMTCQIAASLVDKRATSKRARQLSASLSMREGTLQKTTLEMEKLMFSNSVEKEQIRLRVRELEAENKHLLVMIEALDAEAYELQEHEQQEKSDIENRKLRRIQGREAQLNEERVKRRREHEQHFAQVNKQKNRLVEDRERELAAQLDGYKVILARQLEQQGLELKQKRKHLAAVVKSCRAELEHKKAMTEQIEADLYYKQSQLELVKSQNQAADMERVAQNDRVTYDKNQQNLHSRLKQERVNDVRIRLKEEERDSSDHAEWLQQQRDYEERRLKSALFVKDQNIKRRDAEITSQGATTKRKTAILQGLHQQLDHLHSTVFPRSQIHPLNLQARLTWTQRTDLPTPMGRLQVVVIGEDLYVGGSETESDDTNCQLFKYVLTQDTWSDTYICPVRYFGLGELSGKPVLIGGVSVSTNEVTGDMVLLSDSNVFVSEHSSMPTARSHVCVISLESSLIVCGGRREKTLLTNVEIYKKDTKQWHRADPLPVPIAHMLSTIFGDTCYLMGGDKTSGIFKGSSPSQTVLCAPITTLLQKSIALNQMAEPNPGSTVWKTFQDTQFKNSAPLAVGEMLLAIGGESSAKDIKSAVCAFCPINNTWVHIADLPMPSTMCTAVTLHSEPSNGHEILVIGGKLSNLKLSKMVYTGTIKQETED